MKSSVWTDATSISRKVNTMHPVLNSIFDEKYDEGLTIGRAKGRAEGFFDGKIMAGRGMVLTALETKFKEIPSDIERAVFAVYDMDALESLLVHAIHSSTLDEFATVLKSRRKCRKCRTKQ